MVEVEALHPRYADPGSGKRLVLNATEASRREYLVSKVQILASADKQPVTVGALAFVTASGIQYGQIAAAVMLSILPTLLLALYAQRYLVEGLSLGAVKG